MFARSTHLNGPDAVRRRIPRSLRVAMRPGLRGTEISGSCNFFRFEATSIDGIFAVFPESYHACHDCILLSAPATTALELVARLV